MIPIGDFSLFRDSIIKRYNDYEQITFGILLADPRQTEAREYILNYLDVFNKQSKHYFDFFLPGFDNLYTGPSHDPLYDITVNKKRYYFVPEMFNEYCRELRKSFNILYTYNPMLILMSIKPGYLHTAQFIIIELDDDVYHNVRRSGLLFEKIINIVKNNPDLEHIQINFQIAGVGGNMLNFFVDELSPSWLSRIIRAGNEQGRYRIRHI